MVDLVSVIVPVYNVENYLERCVYSILIQTYSNFELLLIDDGSRDSSGHICDKLGETDNRIRVFHKKNGGLSSARNFGISQSKGKWLAFIDSDDMIHKDFLLKLMISKDKTNADIVSTDMLLFHNDNELSEENRHNGKITVLQGEQILCEYFSPKKGRLYIYHGLCMKIYNRELFNDLSFEEGRLHEDLYITYRLLDKANKFCFVDCPYYYYFQGNSNSICSNFTAKNYFDKVDAFEQMEIYLLNNNIVRNSLSHFLILQYFELIYKGSKLNDSAVQNKNKCLRRKILMLTPLDRRAGLLKKTAYIAMLLNSNLYRWLFAV